MRTRLPVLVAALAVLTSPAALRGQSVWLSPTPPPAIRIVRETVKSGTATAHLANEKAWVATLRSRKVPYSYVGAIAATGAPEFWFFGGAGSFAGLEQLDQSYQQDKSLAKQLDTLMAREAAFVSDAQTILATYRADLSYQPAFIQPESRYFWITTFSVRPGQDETFASAMKTYVSAYAAAKVNAPWVVYELMAGGSNPTFYLIAPMESYGAMDADLAARASVGGKLASPAAIAAQFTASTERMETHILTLSPQISYVPADFAQQDKGFWQAR